MENTIPATAPPITSVSVSRKVRVLFVNTRSQIGADVAVHITLMQNFPSDQVEVHLVTNRNASDLAAMQAALAHLPHVRVLVADLGVEMSSGRGGKIGRLLSGLQNAGSALSLLRLAWYIRRHRIDVLHSTDRPRDALFTMLLTRLTKCPHLLHLHIMWYPEIGRLTNMALARCAGVLAISQFTRQSLHTGGIPDAKIYTALNAIDPVQFSPEKAVPGTLRGSWDVEADRPLIGIVARLIVWKGHQDLIEALAHVKAALPEVRLAIIGNPVGSDDYVAALKQRIRELDLEENVIWAGWHDDMPAVMQDLDVLAVPSWEEPFGLVVTEAMAMERPVVGYCSGALPEIITEGVEGLLVPRQDTTALAAALLTLLRDPQRRAEMGRRGRKRVLRQFTPQRQCAEVAEIYRTLARQKE